MVPPASGDGQESSPGGEAPAPADGTPRHVAIIMDGNGRWAEARGLSRTEGHEQGVKAAHATIEAADELGIEVLTFYVFSVDNWKRPPEEIDFLMDLLADYISEKRAELVEKSIKLRVIGETADLPPRAQDELRRTVEETSSCTRRTLVLAINYGSREEIARAARMIASDAVEGKISAKDVDARLFSRYLYTAGIPEPDLLIRTAGERRLSDFLLWQSSYAELHFTEVCWPDFDREQLEKAIADYRSRRRTFGGLA